MTSLGFLELKEQEEMILKVGLLRKSDHEMV